MNERRKKNRWYQWLLLSVMGMLFMGAETTAHAGTLYDSPYVRFTQDGYAWTIEESLPYTDYIYRYNYPENRPEYWYDKGERMETGITSTIRELNEGEHYYKYKRYGDVPVKYWEVEHPTGWCIHQCEEDVWHGIPDTGDNCKKAYYSGWFAYCADCGEPITTALTYMSRDAAASITSIDVDLGYYYCCPSCTHVDVTTGPDAHECEDISFNMYKVEYDKNVEDPLEVDGLMEASFHMYNNEDVYRGEKVTPITRLSKNVYRRNGYTFAGWNTEPDGSGTNYEDCAEILNLSLYNFEDDNERGTVTLYAKWNYSESTLKIDPATGAYEGRKAIKTITKRYGETYYADPKKVTAPLGYLVSFETNGGESLAPVRAENTFAGWMLVGSLNGKFRDNMYAFLGTNGTIDTLVSTYDLGFITLPTPTKSGESFGGWFSDKACTKPVGFGGDSYIPTANVTLYAKWVTLVLQCEANYTDNGGKGAVNLSWSQPDNQQKTYKLFESTNGTGFVTLYGAKEATQKKETKKDFAYKGAKEVYTVPYSGFYDIFAYGAQGGGTVGSYVGGNGGGCTARIYLTAGEQLTVTVGGQNGYNGGGTGTGYGNGGGATTIVSNLKGTIMVAGGGGAAGQGGNGGAGGESTSLRADKASAGASGYSGGGAGHVGGNAGEHTVHNHTAECMHVHVGDTVSGGRCYTYTDCGSTSFTKNSHCEGSYRCDRDVYGNVIYGDRCGGTCTAYCSHDKKTGHCKNKTTYICNKCGTAYPNVSPGVCMAGGDYVLTCEKTGVAECGYTDGQVLSSKPAYGGSNYVNARYTTNFRYASGKQTGNGKVSIEAAGVGFMNILSLKGVSAPDLAAPDAVDVSTVRFDADGDSAIKVTFATPKDNGTSYWYRAKSYKEGTSTELCTSNITTETLTTGVRGYYYILDTIPVQTVSAANAQNKGIPLTSTSIRVLLKEGVQYLHVAAVDVAGNVGSTTHIKLDYTDVVGAVVWNVETEQIAVTDVINGKDRGTVYQKDAKTYYVRADGEGAFMLSYRSFLRGKADEDYQIDYQIFDVAMAEGGQQRYITEIPYSVPIGSETNLDVSQFVREMSGNSILQDAMNTGAYRKRDAKDNYFYQAFSIPKTYHGKSLAVTPVAGATHNGTVIYSEWEKDVPHAITLIADGEAPIISGLELLENKELIDRGEEKVTLNIVAVDAVSGVKEFYLEIMNTDNFRSNTYYPNQNGCIEVDITEDKTLFAGDITVTAYAVDNVGNETEIIHGATEFSLTAEVERMLSPHEPIFKCGESGILTITTWGYVERIEVEFPKEFIQQNPDLNKSYSYINSPHYKQEETLQFMVPLNVPANEQYVITVRAYKDGKELEGHPSLCTIAVEGSVLDDIRTRLR